MNRRKTYVISFLFQTVLSVCSSLYAAQNSSCIDTVYILVMDSKIEKRHVFSELEIEKLDNFNRALRISFQQRLQLLSGKKCSTYYQVIDYGSVDYQNIIRRLYDLKGEVRRPHYVVHGELHRETDGYRLYLKMVGIPDDLIKISHIIFFPFSQADDTQTASLEGIKAAEIMLSQLCGNQCQPKVVKAFYDTEKNVYYKDLLKLFDLLKKYNFESDNADKMDDKISKLITKTALKHDELFLSHSIIQATFWKNVRRNPDLALIYLTEAKEYYCHKTTNYQDLDLLKRHFSFDQFDEFIQNFIETCTTQK